LERIFGPGAPYLEKLILKSLYEKLGLNIEDLDEPDLVVCADDARKRIKLAGEVKIE
jgi:hypothetical protein